MTDNTLQTKLRKNCECCGTLFDHADYSGTSFKMDIVFSH